jgi:hypothetical protein
MKYKIIKQFCSIILMSIVLLTSCKNKSPVVQKRVILINCLKEFTLDTSEVDTRVKILKTYPIQIDCEKNEKYANLYVCKRIKNSDIIYVFEECEKAPDFAIDTSVHIEVNIDTRKILKKHPKNVTVFIPKEFQIQKNAKYVFASLIGVTDD